MPWILTFRIRRWLWSLQQITLQSQDLAWVYANCPMALCTSGNHPSLPQQSLGQLSAGGEFSSHSTRINPPCQLNNNQDYHQILWIRRSGWRFCFSPHHPQHFLGWLLSSCLGHVVFWQSQDAPSSSDLSGTNGHIVEGWLITRWEPWAAFPPALVPVPFKSEMPLCHALLLMSEHSKTHNEMSPSGFSQLWTNLTMTLSQVGFWAAEYVQGCSQHVPKPGAL